MAGAIFAIVLGISVVFVLALKRQEMKDAQVSLRAIAVLLADHAKTRPIVSTGANCSSERTGINASPKYDFLNHFLQRLGLSHSVSLSFYNALLQPISRDHLGPTFPPEHRVLLRRKIEGNTGGAFVEIGPRGGVIALAVLGVSGDVIAVQTHPDQLAGAWKNYALVVGVIVGLVAACFAILVLLLRKLFEERQLAVRDLGVQKELARQADDANRSKSEYLAIVSHEIRTSMSGVLGMAEFMLRSKLYKEQHSGVRVLYDAGQNLVQIINKILDFSKIESGTLEVVEAPFEPTDLVERVASLFSKEALNKGITFNTVKPTNPVWVLGDELRIRQILANFVGNALKFTRSGGVCLSLQAEPVPDDRDRMRLQFEVRDTGMGIAENLQSKLFQPFHQVDKSIGRKFGGTGLGLSICKRLSDLMGGRIWLESQPGAGSQFFFEIDCAKVAPSGQDVKAEVDVDEAQRGSRGSILLVEDNESNLKIAIMYLERDGYQVTGALDGLEALEKFRDGPFDVILMDGAMPRMDGYEATRQIRQIESDEKRARVPIIATTANTGPENEAKCKSAGMDDFVPKPYRFSDLKVKLERWIAAI